MSYLARLKKAFNENGKEGMLREYRLDQACQKVSLPLISEVNQMYEDFRKSLN